MTSTVWRNLPAYLEIAGIWARMVYAYRANVIFNLVSVILQVYLLRVVWTSVYTGRTSVDGIALEALIIYLTLANLQLWIMSPFIAAYIRSRVREGQVAIDLTRPVGFLHQMVAGELGATAGRLPFLLIAFPWALLAGDMQPPASISAGAFYAVSLTMAYLIAVLLGLILGLTSFWTMEIQGIQMIYSLVSQFFAGALVPLWFFPAPLRTVAELLPFQASAFIPVSVYLSERDGAGIAGALLVQAGWVVILSVVAWGIWRRAFRRVVIQGG